MQASPLTPLQSTGEGNVVLLAYESILHNRKFWNREIYSCGKIS